MESNRGPFDPDAAEVYAYERRMLRGGRRYPCPTCKTPNALSARQHAKGYQCDRCADRAERGEPGY